MRSVQFSKSTPLARQKKKGYRPSPPSEASASISNWITAARLSHCRTCSCLASPPVWCTTTVTPAHARQCTYMQARVAGFVNATEVQTLAYMHFFFYILSANYRAEIWVPQNICTATLCTTIPQQHRTRIMILHTIICHFLGNRK